MSRTISYLTVTFVVLSLCSFMETSQEKLVGRWFNSRNSIRFTAVGHVRWNSPRGIAQGNYSYDGSLRRASSNVAVRNLSLDMTRNGKPLQADFELQFIGDKLRLTPMSTANSEAIIILKRAGADDEETLIPLVKVPTSADAASGLPVFN